MVYKLAPGPTLDRRVAEIIDVELVTFLTAHPLYWRPRGEQPLYWRPRDESPKPWCPSTDRGQACGPVLDWLWSRLSMISFDPEQTGAAMIALWVGEGDARRRHHVPGATLEHALCLAVLHVADQEAPNAD